jgi:diacylglycerol O-acyltransferase/trehalose O-mycolyltransferase
MRSRAEPQTSEITSAGHDAAQRDAGRSDRSRPAAPAIGAPLCRSGATVGRDPVRRGLMRLRAALVVVVAAAAPSLGCGDRPTPDSDGAAQRASVISENRVGRRLVDLSIRSHALGTTAKVRLMTPYGWSSQRGSRRWPVLYLLHGCCDTYDSWTRSTDLEDLPQLRDVLVVMPEAGKVGFYTNWLGSGQSRSPAWETFHLSEVPQILERGYGASTRRVVAGLSMGGLGAMVYSAHHPGFFRAAASFSGLLHPLEDTDFLLGLFSGFTPDPLAIWGDPTTQRGVWARHDPTELAARLRGARLFVSAGNGHPGPFETAKARQDRIEPTMLKESRAFVRRLRQLNIPVRADLYGPGVHDWPYWERELRRALPLLLGALKQPR